MFNSRLPTRSKRSGKQRNSPLPQTPHALGVLGGASVMVVLCLTMATILLGGQAPAVHIAKTATFDSLTALAEITTATERSIDLTATKHVNQTQVAAAITQRALEPTPTWTSTPTATSTPTPTYTATPVPPTATATSTATATATPTPVCSARVTGQTELYLQPSRGGPYVPIPRGAVVYITYRIQDTSWWPVYYDNVRGWLSSDVVAIEAGCSPVVSSLADRLSVLDGLPTRLYSDDFIGNPRGWYLEEDDGSSRILTPRQTENGDMALQLNGRGGVITRMSNPLPGTVDFRLATSFRNISWIEYSGHIGFRFRISDQGYYELQVRMGSTEACFVSMIDSRIGEFWRSDPIAGCLDAIEDYLVLDVRGNTFSVALNGVEFVDIGFASEPMVAARDTLQLVVDETVTEFYFITIAGYD